MRLSDGLPPGGRRASAFLLLWMLTIVASSQYGYMPGQAPPGTSSLVFVFDITGSMFDDLVQVRQGAKEIFKTVMAQGGEKLIYNYILVPFHDPDLGEIINTTDSLYFQRQLNKVHVFGGGDCPEMTLTGIKTALELALPSSFVYVFTDARSKDYHLEESILNLIQEKQSSVVFVMTGDCGNRTHPGFRTYEKIAAASFGQVFHLQKSDVNKVLEYVRHAVVQKKVHIMYESRDHGDTLTRTIPVDKHMTELTLSLSGDKSDERALDIILRDPTGKVVEKDVYNNEGGTLDLMNVKLIRLKDPMPGNWQIMTKSKLKHTLRVFGHGAIDFKYGFASRPLEMVELARPRPVADQNTYLLVNITGLQLPGTVSEIALVDYYGTILRSGPATPHPTNPYLFFIGPFPPPRGLFFVRVKGIDDQDYEFQRIAPTAIGSVAVGGPRAFMRDRLEAFSGSNVNLNCSVESESRYTIYWKKGDEIIGGPLFYETSDTATWTINVLSEHDRGEYKCVVVSDSGNQTVTTFLETKESPPQIIAIRNESVAMGGPAFLHCQIQSISRLEIRWLRHGVDISNMPNTKVFPNGTLRLEKVSHSDSGAYECQARNAGGISQQGMLLKVLELPKARVTPSQFFFVGVNTFNISCVVSGDPRPEVEWYHNGNRILPDSKYYITFKNELYVRDPTQRDEGTYECRAVSSGGVHSDFSQARLAHPPSLEMKQSRSMIGRGDNFTIECNVREGNPPPVIQWFRNNKELLQNSHQYIQIVGNQLHIQGAQDTDAGTYSCVADNLAGRDIATLQISIGSMPSILPSATNVLSASIGHQGTLPCRVIGYPPPTITWYRDGNLIDMDTGRYKIQSDGTLIISEVEVGDHGTYTCTASNPYGEQSQSSTFMVTGLIAPVLGRIPPEEQLIQGHDLRLNCIVVFSNPKPVLHWLKDGKPLEQTDTAIIEGGGTSLLLRNGNPDDEGRYSCVAVSPAGNASIVVNVQLISESIGKDTTTVGDWMDTGKTIGRSPIQGRIPEGRTPIQGRIPDGRSPTQGRIPDRRPSVKGIPPGDRRRMTSARGPIRGFAETPVNAPQRPIARNIPIGNKTSQMMRNTLLNASLFRNGMIGNSVLKNNSLGTVIRRGVATLSHDRIGTLRSTSYPSYASFEILRPLRNTTTQKPQTEANKEVHILPVPLPVVGSDRPSMQTETLVKVTAPPIGGSTNNIFYEDVADDELQYSGEEIDHNYIIAPENLDEIYNSVLGAPIIHTEGKELNDTVKMRDPLVVDGIPKPQVAWFLDGKPIERNDYNDEYEYQENNLLVKNPTKTYAGEYTCTAINSKGSSHLIQPLQVISAPVILPGQTIYNMVHESEVVIPCEVDTEPLPEIKWYLNNEPFEGGHVDERGSLHIDKLLTEHKGQWKCVATNEAGEDERIVNLTVHTAPIIDGSGETKSITVQLNNSLELPCPAHATPPPARVWKYEGEKINTDRTFMGQKLTMTAEGTLVIPRALLHLAGQFVCHVSNLAGDDSITYNIKVIEPPRIVSDTPGVVDVVMDMALDIPCKAIGTPEASITWEKDGFQLVDDPSVHIEESGTLRIMKSKPEHAGVYTCSAKNPGGTDTRTTVVVVQEKPVILSSTLSNYTSVEGDKVELRCYVSANPPAAIEWLRKGEVIKDNIPGVTVDADGTLIIEAVTGEDAMYYTCRATNPAGTTEKVMRLSVIVAPDVRDSDIVEKESVRVEHPFSLYCPVTSLPLPHISWHLDDKPIAEGDSNIHLSEDKRKLSVLRARITDAGVYKCIARNSAGESSKTFEVEVTEPPNLDETKWKRKVTIKEGEEVEFGCPVSGIPPPTILWIINGQVLKPGEESRGVRLGEKGDTVIINMADAEHQGSHQCVAANKAGSLDIDVELTVLAPPRLGNDSTTTVLAGRATTILCDFESDHSTTVSWIVNGSSTLPSNVQVPLGGKRLFIMDTSVKNTGDYTCIARNSAGEGRKTTSVQVLVPPTFLDEQSDQNVQVTSNKPMTLECKANGSPMPEVIWRKDGENLQAQGVELSNNGQTLTVDSAESGRYTCIVENKAGSISRDFFVQSISAPVITDGDDRTVIEVIEGQSATLQCPIESGSDVEIEWRRQGRDITASDMVSAVDKTRLVILNAQEEHEDAYTCIAKNSAGSAVREFQVIVLIPPRINGPLLEDVEVIEGEEMNLNCDFTGHPTPSITWTRDGDNVPARSKLLNDNRQLALVGAEAHHAGVYKCALSNKVGAAEKTFNVRILSKPDMEDIEVTPVEVLLSRPHTFECPVSDMVGVNITWLKHELPVTSGMDNVQILAGGRHLHVPGVREEDQGSFKCVAKNKAGETSKAYALSVLVPPTIMNPGGEYTVIENNSLLLPCEVDGSPPPEIVWTKDGRALSSIKSVQVMSEGMQFKIAHAEISHKGSYSCSAKNKVGGAEINFEVDVITRPSVVSGIRDTIEVISGETAYLKCPVKDKNYDEVTWIYGTNVLKEGDPHLIISSDGVKLHVDNSTVRDEGTYTCRLKNAAGTVNANYKLIVLVPPQIVLLDKDINRSPKENASLTLSCPATGKPEPTIKWMYNGEPLHETNISSVIKSASLIGNEIKISRISAKNSGRFTCEAKNKAGVTEQDMMVTVMTKPRIEREGIPSEIEEVADRAFTISCPVYGKPQPTVTWLKSGRPLDEHQNVKTSSNGQKLYFMKFSKDEVGSYTCVATNPAGDDKRDFAVKLLEAPTFEGPNLVRQQKVIAGKTAILNCPASASPPPTITWLKDGQTLAPSRRHVFLDSGRQLQISNTTREDKARYTCIATNSVGSDDLETTLDVLHMPVIIGPRLEKEEVVLDDRLDLICDVDEADSTVEIEWQKDGKTISHDMIRENVYLQIPPSGRRLHILSANVTDAGKYVCIARNGAGDSRKSFDVKVLVPPTINEEVSSDSLQTVVPASEVRIECAVSGSPLPEIIWRRNGELLEVNENVQLRNENRTLVVQEIREGLDGRYTCEAENSAGHIHKDFVVRLTGPPVFDLGHENLEMAVGDSMTLTCMVTSGTGHISVSWEIDGNVAGNGTYSPSVEVNDRRIKIQDARLSDSGEYVCIAQNDAGEARKTFELSVLERPRFLDMTNANPSIIVSRPLVLDCSVSGIPQPTIQWTKDGAPVNESAVLFVNSRQQLHIEEATLEDEGRYSCIAENNIGRAEKELIVAILKPPKMTTLTQVQEVQQGETKTLVCPIEGDNTMSISWTKNGLPITTSSEVQLSLDHLSLHLMNADPSDTGEYACVAENEAGTDSAEFSLSVLVAPKILSDAFRSMDVVLNQTVEIECEASGVPPPLIEWFFDGKPLFEDDYVEIAESGRILRLLNIPASREGRYSCKAQNTVGVAEGNTFLKVSAPPRVGMSSKEMKVIAGQPITIRCEVFGDPPPEVEWKKNGQPFQSDLVQSSPNLQYIHLREAEAKDAGTYSCIATNRAGEHMASADLLVLVAPIIEDGERVLQVKENNSVDIVCSAIGTPPPVITWTKDGKKLEATGERLHIPSVNISHAGRITCQARNEAGTATADFAVDILSKPKFKDYNPDIQVVEGERTKIECKVEGHPTPTIQWLRGGRPIEDMSNLLLSPRGESLMILKARRSDAGMYSCVAKNAAGESEAGFEVSVLVAPHIDETIDQSPRVVHKDTLLFSCPVLGNPPPLVEWTKDGEPLEMDDRMTIIDMRHLEIKEAKEGDAGRYTCKANNKAGQLITEFKPEIISLPKFEKEGDSVYDVIEHDSVTMTCAVSTETNPDISWFRGDHALDMNEDVTISPDGMQLTIRNAQISHGGKYKCQAKNEAGTSIGHLILKVLVPPKLDESNIIGNPLTIIGTKFALECPVSGIPQPTIEWLKEGEPVNFDDTRISLAQNNQTLSVEGSRLSDQARYTCIATNKGGKVEQDFQLEVLVPPEMDLKDAQNMSTREGATLTLACPVKLTFDASAVTEIQWVKDGRPIDAAGNDHIKVFTEGRRLQLSSVSLSDAGRYSCVAQNRAGESSVHFHVEILSVPTIDTSKTDISPRAIVGQPVTLNCPVSGYPFPAIKWMLNGEEAPTVDTIRYSEDKQVIEILSVREEDAGKWTCLVENDAGNTELDINLDVWVPPAVTVYPEDTAVKPVGESVTLHCNATGNPTPSLTWNKGGEPLVSSPTGARISHKGWRLDVPNLSRDHVGDYTCHARNEAGSAEGSIRVDVLIPPMINRTGLILSPKFKTGGPFLLTCDSSGKPPPENKWYLNGTEIVDDIDGIMVGEGGKYIQMSNISIANRGVYTCVSQNHAGNDTVMFNVDVQEHPVILNAGEVTKVIEGEVATLECEAEGHPKPITTWLRNGVRVETGAPGVRYITEGKKLTIIDARSGDSGLYVCMAVNEVGTVQQAFNLEILIAPKITSGTNESVSMPVGKPFPLKCAHRGYPAPDIQWTVNGNPIKNQSDGYTLDSDGTLHVTSTKTRIEMFKCTATNDAGTDSIEYTVVSIDAPKAPKELEKIQNVTEGTPSVIACDIKGDTSTITWTKNGVNIQASSNVDFNEERSVLSINNTKLNDEGDYVCTVKNTAGEATQKIRLNVGVPPRITEEPKRVIVKNGETAELWCEAIGVPQPAIMWYKDDKLLTESAIEKHTETRKATAIFSNVTPDKTGIYTCKAKNWAGETYKEVGLVVLTEPVISPEKLNISVTPRDTVVLPCNATGVPEPVITWVRHPSVEISPNEKYQFIGTSLAIRNAIEDDSGYYHCIAKSEAGQKVGSRRLTITDDKPGRPRVMWLDCDENNVPIKKTFIPDRGDAPEQSELLPWGDQSDLAKNGTGGVFVRCMPGNRNARELVLMSSLPLFQHIPSNLTVPVGSPIEMYCSSVGSPVPLVYWTRNGEFLEEAGKQERSSVLYINSSTEEDAGQYKCHAANDVGTIEAPATVTVEPEATTTVPPPLVNKKNITLLSCLDKGHSVDRDVRWFLQGIPVEESSLGAVLLNNGSLSISHANLANKEAIADYKCKVRGRRRSNDAVTMEVEDVPPVVTTTSEQLHFAEGSTAVIDCLLTGQPLTTSIQWMRNGMRIHEDSNVRILPNNSLELRDVLETDRGEYKCRAENALGKAFDDVDVIVDDQFPGAVGFIEGFVNNEKIEHQALTATITPDTDHDNIDVQIEQLEDNSDLVRFASSPNLPLSMKPRIDEFERDAEFTFETGEKMKVHQIATGTDENGFLILQTTIEGNTPLLAKSQNASIGKATSQFMEMDNSTVHGTGRSTILAGKHKIPFTWTEEIRHNETEKPSIPNGKHLRVDVNPIKGQLIAKSKVVKGCPHGFKLEKGRCRDVDECETGDPCGEEAECVNTIGSFECIRHCEEGYRVRMDGSCADEDECKMGTHECAPTEECRNTPGAYECVEPCAKGLQINDEGICEDIDECENPSACLKHLKCLNQYATYVCLCPNGAPPRNGTCRAPNRKVKTIHNTHKKQKHNCPTGYTLQDGHCEDIDECTFDMPCQFGCENTQGGYECSCPEGYELGEEGKCTDVNECDNGPCGDSDLCFNMRGDYECLSNPCPEDYHLDNETLNCIPWCLDELACPLPKVQLSLLALPAEMPAGTPIATLTAYDDDSKFLSDTKFTFETPEADHDVGLTKDDAFNIKTDKGRASVVTNRPLSQGYSRTLRVRARSSQAHAPDTHFLLYVSVGEHPF